MAAFRSISTGLQDINRMTTKRPPLDLTEPKSRRVRLKPLASDSEANPTANPAEPDVLETEFTLPRGKKAQGKTADATAIKVEVTPPAAKTPPALPTEPEKTAVNREISPLRTQAENAAADKPSSPALFWGAATAISLLWAAGLVAFVLGAQGDNPLLRMVPLQAAILAVLAVFPIGMVFAAFFAIRKGAELKRQSRRAEHMANQMVAPAVAAAAQTTDMVESLRAQVDHAVRAVRLAQDDITQLSTTLRTESERLFDAAQSARATTQSIRRIFDDERRSLERLSEQLETRTQDVLATVERQALMVTEASDLAQAQLREAEAMLTARTTDFAATADDVKSTTLTVAGELDRQSERLQTAGLSVAGQIRAVEENLGQQRAGLVSAALSLRADQEEFANHIEGLRGQLTEALSITRVATVDLGETSSRGVEVLRDLLMSAQSQFRELLNAAEGERGTFETRIHATLSSISLMAADARDDLVSETRRSLEQLELSAAEARRAADAAAQMAQTRVDRLNESLFEAGKKADEVFDTRLNSARRLIENSAGLITEAGDQTIEKLDATFAQTRDAILQVNHALTDLSANAGQLPQMAQESLADIRRSVEDGLMAMTQAARKATLESEALDLAFQDRVRRNYDMLSEAVRLMGVLSGDSHAASASLPGKSQNTSLNDTPLKDRSARPAPEPPAPRKPTRPEGESWSWRDLLGSIESDPKPAPPLRDIRSTGPDDQLLKEVEALGMDTAAVFNQQRVDEVITALLKGDNETPRHMVRRLTPGAVRRLGRRLTADEGLLKAANAFTARIDRDITRAIPSDDPTGTLRDLLLNDTGRAYLLLDAALSDLI